MGATTGFADVLMLLTYRDHFRNFGLALTMIGFAPDPDFVEVLTDATVSISDPSDEDERIYSEHVDGWVPPRNEKWEAGPGNEADISDEAADDLIVENIETYGEDWQLARPPPSWRADNRGEGAGRERHKMGDTRNQTPRFVIAHVLSPTSSEERPPSAFAYHSVSRRKRAPAPSERLGRLDEAAWRLALECLSATDLKSRRQSIDIAACVDALARSKPIERMPMREHGVRRVAADTVLRDISLSNGPLGGDIAAFVASIQANSRHAVDILGFSETVETLGCGKGPIWSWRPLDMVTLGQRVIVVSNLPPGAQRRHAAWRQFAQSLTASGRHFAFVSVGETTAPMSGDWPGLWFNLVC